MAGEDCPCLIVDSDVNLSEPFAHARGGDAIQVAVCRDFEHEAQRTAAQVLARSLRMACSRSRLIAQDRLLTRRVRALLERQHVPMLDETGWKLSTTRAGARVAALVRAAQREAGSDDWLDWLKGCDWPGTGEHRRAVRALEAALRRFGWTALAAVDAHKLEPLAAQLWHAATELIERVARAAPTRPCGMAAGASARALEDSRRDRPSAQRRCRPSGSCGALGLSRLARARCNCRLGADDARRVRRLGRQRARGRHVRSRLTARCGRRRHAARARDAAAVRGHRPALGRREATRRECAGAIAARRRAGAGVGHPDALASGAMPRRWRSRNSCAARSCRCCVGSTMTARRWRRVRCSNGSIWR